MIRLCYSYFDCTCTLLCYFFLSSVYLYEVGEGDTDNHQLVDDSQQVWVGQHAVVHTGVQEVRVVGKHVVNVGNLNKNNTVLET